MLEKMLVSIFWGKVQQSVKSSLYEKSRNVFPVGDHFASAVKKFHFVMARLCHLCDFLFLAATGNMLQCFRDAPK